MILSLNDLYRLKGRAFTIDTETTGLRWYQNGLIGIGIHCPDLDLTGYIPTCSYQEVPYGKPKRAKKYWGGEYTLKNGRKVKVMIERLEEEVYATRMEAVPIASMRAEASRILTEIAEDPGTLFIMHNAKFDMHFLDLDLWRKPCRLLDTSVMVHLYDSRLKKSLDAAEDYFLGTNSKRAHKEEVPKIHKNHPWLWNLKQVEDYCTNDCIVTFQLAKRLTPLITNLQLTDLLRVQMRYIRCLWRIERRGMQLNADFCNQAVSAFKENLKLMEEELYDSCGNEFNWRAHGQLSKAIYEGLGIEKPVNPFADEDGVDRTRFAHKGRYNKHCTSAFLLMEKGNHPLGGLILDMREADKLRKAVETYLELGTIDGFIHTNFRATGTRTGRLSSSEPNVQNIASEHRVRETQSSYSGGAIRQDEYNLRRAFMSRPGYTFVSIDHRQQEMRMFGILALEPVMLKALKERRDIHLEIAKAVWGDCGPERNALHREWSKTIGFGLIYGMTTGSLQFRLNKTAEEAEQIANQYWNTFPRIQPWLQEVIDELKANGYVRYWSGRIWMEENEMDMYKGANAQIQGGAADLMQLAVMRAQCVLEEQGWGGGVSIIHDEALFEVKDKFVDVACPVLARILECEDLFGLPFSTDVKIGKTYGTMEKRKIAEDLGAIDWRDYFPATEKVEDYYLAPWTGKINVEEIDSYAVQAGVGLLGQVARQVGEIIQLEAKIEGVESARKKLLEVA